MEGHINYLNDGLLEKCVFMPEKCNKLWGTDFLLMDSKHLMGKDPANNYGVIIDMFVKVWHTQNGYKTNAAS